MDDRTGIDTDVRPVETHAVQGRMLAVRPSAPTRSGVEMTAETSDLVQALLPDEIATWMRAHRGVIVGTVVVGALTELLPDAPWILIIPLLAGIAAHRIGSRLPFTFATGLIGPRADSPGRSMS